MHRRRLSLLIPVVAVLALLVPRAAATTGTPGGIAAFDYAVASAPSGGFTSVSFPLTVVQNADPQAAWLWENEVSFVGDNTVATLGLQPSGPDGQTAVLSVAGDGTTPDMSSCTTDTGGTSCQTGYAWNVNTTYEFTVSLVTSSTTAEEWQGTVVDESTDAITTIGEFTVPASRGLIRPLAGVAQYDAAISDCADLPQMYARYDAPVATLAGMTYPGTIADARTYGSTDGGAIDCGSAAHVSETAASGYVAAPQPATAGSGPTSGPTTGPTGPSRPVTTQPAPLTHPPLPGAVLPVVPATRCNRFTVTLSTSVIVVPAGSGVLLTGVVSVGAKVVAGVPVSLTERYADGKVVPLGTSNTDATGTFAHHDRPLYNGSVTAHAGCVTSPPVPSRVTVSFGSLRVTRSGAGTVTVTTSSRPGFVTAAHRSERVQLILTDRGGLTRQVLATTDAAQRSQPRGEPQGVNVISFKRVSLPRGVHYLAVRVLGTPVNVGAVSRPVRFLAL